MLIRGAVIGPDGIVPTDRVIAALGARRRAGAARWVAAWSDAEAARPWPPDLR